MSRVANISPGPGQQSIYKIADNVTGTYDLHNSLLISTVSGHVDVTIRLHPGDSQAPADLKINSMSGSIKVGVVRAAGSTKESYHRKMDTHISLVSGTILATLPHSHRTTLKSVSGAITANLYPEGSTTEPTEINMESTSGRMNLTLHPHVADPGHPLTRLSTTCKGVTGNAKLTYPLTWQGQVKVHAQLGKVTTVWPGLSVTRNGSEMSATIGEGEGKIWVAGVTTNVELVGKDFGLAAPPPAEAAKTAVSDAGDLPPPTYGEAMRD